MKKIINIIKEEISYLNEDIKVYHGSTSKFDKFDQSKVGTGDGKSLGGWGIYFSNNINVSKRYYLPSGQLKQYKIPNGEYFDLDDNINDGQRIINALKKLNISSDDIQEFQSDFLDYSDTNNKQVYDWLAYILKSEKNASLFLSKLGYVGNTMKDRWENAQNYIVFNPEDIINIENNYEDNDDENSYNNYDDNSIDEDIMSRAKANMFNITDDDKEMDYKAQIELDKERFNNNFNNNNTPNNNIIFDPITMGVFIGNITFSENPIDVRHDKNSSDVISRVFMNPRNLENFDDDVKAISDINGNVFICDRKKMFYHDAIKKIVNKYKNEHNNSVANIISNNPNFIEWYRIANTNKFGLAGSYYNYRFKNEKLYQDNLNKNKNLEFIFKHTNEI